MKKYCPYQSTGHRESQKHRSVSAQAVGRPKQDSIRLKPAEIPAIIRDANFLLSSSPPEYFPKITSK